MRLVGASEIDALDRAKKGEENQPSNPIDMGK